MTSRVRSDSDSPRMGTPARGGAHVMGERTYRKPADARHDKRGPVLPVVTRRQLAKHPRATEYAGPHSHKGGARCVACPVVAPRVAPVAPHWTVKAPAPAPVSRRWVAPTAGAPTDVRDLAGRSAPPQTVAYRQQRTPKTAWSAPKVEADPVPPSEAFRPTDIPCPPARIDPIVKVPAPVGAGGRALDLSVYTPDTANATLTRDPSRRCARHCACDCA